MPSQASQPSHCVVCEVGCTSTPRNGVTTCRSCREFFRRHSLANRPTTPCPRSGNCPVTRNSRASCAPCRLRRCVDAGMRIDNPAASSQPADDDEVCAVCNQINRAKRTIVCAECSRPSHLTCVRITRLQADQLPTWHCDGCLRSTALGDAVQDRPTIASETPPQDMVAALANLKAGKRVLQYVPRSQRHRVASDLASAIIAALEQRTPTAWWCLFSYAYNSPLACTPTPTASTPDQRRGQRIAGTTESSDDEALARRITRKCADGDIRAALRLLTTSDSVAPPSEETLATLRAKHPPSDCDEALPQLSDADPGQLEVSRDDVLAAIHAFPPGSAAGLDGIRPMHLRQLVAKNTAEAGQRLLEAITKLCNAALAGNIPEPARHAFFSANLIALRKKDGGLRPIAVGTIFRRLASKLLAKRMSAALSSELCPTQLGVGTPLGCEAAVHAVREFADTHAQQPGFVIIKLDIANAFNTLHRSAVLREVLRRFPIAAPLVSQAYSQPSPLYLGPNCIWSRRGVQQGDPLGPLLFALAVDPVIRTLDSPLNVWFLDDGTLAGHIDTVAADLQRILPAFRDMGLNVNQQKCEITHLGPRILSDGPSNIGNNAPSTSNHNNEENLTTTDAFLSRARSTPLNNLSLLGAPIHPDSTGEALDNIQGITKTLIHRTGLISSHMALFFLSRYASVPRATHLMRTAPVYMEGDNLSAIDKLLWDATSRSCNVALDNDAWTQASLPLRLGGLGIRRLADVALPAYIASVDATRDLVCNINRRPNGDRPARLASAIDTFTTTHCPGFNPEEPLTQRHLDEAASEHRLSDLMSHANQVDRARLLAARAPHSGAWLSAIPVEKLGLLLPDEAVRTGVALRLGISTQQPHRCRCGAMADRLGHHNLSCNRDPGRLPRHTALNDVVYRSLASAGVAAILEPRGLDRGDGRRPDGITLYPFRQGKMLAWDATCVNTFSSTHLIECAAKAGAAASSAEARKRQRYADLGQRYDFVPLTVETTGVLGTAFNELIKDLGRRIRERTGEKRETEWLRQRVSLAVIRGNAAALCQQRPT